MTESSRDEIVYRFGEFELYPRERRLVRHGERISLTPRAFDLLVALVSADGRLLSKDTLMERVWADAAVEEGNLNRTISALRKALGESKGNRSFIETVPKAGYRFIADIETWSGLSRVPSRPDEPTRVEALAVPGRVWPRAAAIATFVIIFGSLAGTYFIFRGRADRSVVAAEHTKVPRLTTAPFDEDSAYWTDDGKIRFARLSNPGRSDSMIMDADGSNQRQDTASIADFAGGVWSRDGRKVIYTKIADGSRSYYLAEASGSNEIKLPFGPGPLAWSPDGTQVVVNNRAAASNLNSEIFVYTVATAEFKNISNNLAFDADPTFSPDGRLVTFISDRDGSSGVYVMNSDGSNVRQLTNDGSRVAFPVFSPDGTQIAFNSDRDNEKVGIYLIGVDGGTSWKISDTSYNSEIRPGCWSADGTKLVFTSDAGGDKYNVHVLTDVEPHAPTLVIGDTDADIQSASSSADGAQLALGVKLADGRGELRMYDVASRTMRRVAELPEGGLAPALSPDARSIALQVKSSGNTEIFLVDAATGAAQNLTQNPARDGSPAWSPDGKAIIFSSNRDGSSENSFLFTMNADGSGVRRLFSRSGYELLPAIAGDGRTIAFAGDRADGSSRALDIFIADLTDQSMERIVTRLRFHDTEPAFSPDGKTLAFTSQSDGNKEIYLVREDGSGLVRLTRNAADDTTPRFSHDGKSLYFVSNRSGKLALYQIELAAG